MTRSDYLAAAHHAFMRAVAKRETTVAGAVAHLPVPSGVDRRCLGPLAAAAERAGLIERVRWTTSPSRTSHHAPVTLWRSATTSTL